VDSIYDFPVTKADGEVTTLRPYEGQVLLIVNVASKCGLTPQYEGLEALHRNNGASGLRVLGFPCNQFGEQEPGTDTEIQGFCSTNYDVTFPVFAKIDVNGPTRIRSTNICGQPRRATSARNTAGFTTSSGKCAPRRSAPTRSSGTSPSSWSTELDRCCADTSPPWCPTRSRPTCRPCWPLRHSAHYLI